MPQQNYFKPDAILRRPAVQSQTGLSKTQLDRMEEMGQFPRRRKISERIVGWSANEVQQWIQDRLRGQAV
jgi:prophage regulatory protein